MPSSVLAVMTTAHSAWAGQTGRPATGPSGHTRQPLVYLMFGIAALHSAAVVYPGCGFN